MTREAASDGAGEVTLAPDGGKRALLGGASYALITVAQRALAFLLLPLYASVLSPAEYGDVGLLLVSTQALVVVMGLGQNVAIFREWFQLAGKDDERVRYVRTVAVLMLTAPALLAILFIPFAVVLGTEWWNVSPPLLVLSGIGAALFVAATVLPFTLLRVQERFVAFAALNAANAGATTIAAVVGLLVFKWGVGSWVFGYIVGGLVTICVAVPLLSLSHGAPDRRYATRTLRTGLPLVPHQLALWGLQLANRAVLAGLVTKTEVGFFTVAYMVTQPVMLISASVNQAVMPSYGRASVDHRLVPWLSKLTTYQVAGITWLTLCFALVVPPVVGLILPSAYAPAVAIVPIMALASGIFSLYVIPMNEVTIFTGRSGRAWIVTTAAAAIGVGSLFVLVPESGLLGAAWGALLGAVVLVVGMAVYARIGGIRRAIPYEWKRLAAIAVIGLFAFLVGDRAAGESTLGDLLVRGAWSLGLLVLVAMWIRRDAATGGHTGRVQ